jgi:hypothetical protein
MKTVEKITRDGDIQTFEIITSRKELASFMHDTLWESYYSSYAKDEGNIHTDADTSTFYYDKDGNFFSITEGDKVKKPNISKIEKLLQHNGCTTVIYGNAPIVFNEHYGDWEVDFD